MRLPSPSARNSLAEQVTRYHSQVAGPATSYLADRGIYQQAIDRFQLGYTGETGTWLRNRLSIPYLTPAGAVGMKYRCITDHRQDSGDIDCKDLGHPKYGGEDDAAVHLFNAQVLRTATTVVGVEGELDAIAGEMTGFAHVGVPGTGVWKSNPHWVWCFDNVEEFVFVADGDEPKPGKKIGVGEELADTVCRSLRQHYPDMFVRKVVLPVGQDPNSFINGSGDIPYLEQIGLI